LTLFISSRIDASRNNSKIQIILNGPTSATPNSNVTSALKEDFNSRLEFRIKIKDLEILKQAIDVGSLFLLFLQSAVRVLNSLFKKNLPVDKNEQYKFCKEEFVNFLSVNLDKGTEQEVLQLGWLCDSLC
jgi:hypothetical protein